MDAPFLAIDLGNRRLKAALFLADGAPERAIALDHEEVPSGWAPWVAGCAPVRGAAISSVLAPEQMQRTLATLQAALPVAVAVNPGPGLILDVRSPETVGLDRLYAARAALERGAEEAIVVDVGTALTVDAVQAGAPAGSPGTFLGGAIAPGPELVARALSAAAQLYEVSPRPDAPALGKDTRSALEAGIVHTVAGAAVRLAEAVRRESGLDQARLLLTGGARAFVFAALVSAGWQPIEAPHLVLEGLRASGAVGREGA